MEPASDHPAQFRAAAGTLALLREVYDRFQDHAPIFAVDLEADPTFAILKSQAPMEELLYLFPAEPTLQPIILQIIEDRRDLRTVEFLVMAMQRQEVLVYIRSGISMQVIDVRGEIGETLSVMTGVDHGRDPEPKVWLLWWKANTGKYPKQL